MLGTQQKQLIAGCSHNSILLSFDYATYSTRTYTIMIAQTKSYNN
jgi:hypothetical protein